jgi:spermidine/putrescine transport system ATP-binding protein
VNDVEEFVMVELVNVTKSFQSTVALRGINLKVYSGEFFTLLGPSGCGKTTTLRLIGGFDTPDSGEIYLNNKPVIGKRPFERDVNTVFQSYALFPHMTVAQNVGFGLRMKGVSQAQIRERVKDALAMVKMQQYADRSPKKLSGGEQQRIAVARAIINDPPVLLLDEPLGSLDLKLRKAMQLELKQLQKMLKITFIYVTHDQEEALTMSDRVGVMNKGFLEQVDTPINIYKSPHTKFIADFIGDTNLLKCIVQETKENEIILRCEGVIIRSTYQEDQDLSRGDNVYLSIRPEDISVSNHPSGEANEYQASVQQVIFIGHSTRIITTPEFTAQMVAHIPSTRNPDLFNQQVFIHWNPQHCVIVRE